MSRQTTLTCDHCETATLIGADGGTPRGWIEIAFGFTGDDEDGPEDLAHFCSWACAAGFCGEQARATGARQRPAKLPS